MDFELSSEFSRIQAIPHFTIFAKKSGLTRDWIQETLSTKLKHTHWLGKISVFFIFSNSPENRDYETGSKVGLGWDIYPWE